MINEMLDVCFNDLDQKNIIVNKKKLIYFEE